MNVTSVGIDVNENTQVTGNGNLDGRKVCTHLFKFMAYLSFTIAIVSGTIWGLHSNENYRQNSETIFYCSIFIGTASLSYYFADYFTDLYCR